MEQEQDEIINKIIDKLIKYLSNPDYCAIECSEIKELLKFVPSDILIRYLQDH